MTNLERAVLMLRIAFETVRYDVQYAARGFHGVHRSLRRPVRLRQGGLAEAFRIAEAYEIVSAFHWRPILCLQRSVIVARVMHAYGIPAQVVIGYTFLPFLSHAWVEVEGRVVNDSAGFAERMAVLARIEPATVSA
jgi:hypothetical protein